MTEDGVFMRDKFIGNMKDEAGEVQTFCSSRNFRCEVTEQIKIVFRSNFEPIRGFLRQPADFVLHHLPVSGITDYEVFIRPVRQGKDVLDRKILRRGTAEFRSPLEGYGRAGTGQHGQVGRCGGWS